MEPGTEYVFHGWDAEQLLEFLGEECEVEAGSVKEYGEPTELCIQDLRLSKDGYDVFLGAQLTNRLQGPEASVSLCAHPYLTTLQAKNAASQMEGDKAERWAEGYEAEHSILEVMEKNAHRVTCYDYLERDYWSYRCDDRTRISEKVYVWSFWASILFLFLFLIFNGS